MPTSLEHRTDAARMTIVVELHSNPLGALRV